MKTIRIYSGRLAAQGRPCAIIVNLGRFYNLVSMEGKVSILLGCLHASRTVSYCFSLMSRSPLRSIMKNKIYGTIAANPSQANL